MFVSQYKITSCHQSFKHFEQYCYLWIQIPKFKKVSQYNNILLDNLCSSKSEIVFIGNGNNHDISVYRTLFRSTKLSLFSIKRFFEGWERGWSLSIIYTLTFLMFSCFYAFEVWLSKNQFSFRRPWGRPFVLPRR